MKKILLLLVTLGLFYGGLYLTAQQDVAPILLNGATLPGQCSVNQIFIKKGTNPGIYWCDPVLFTFNGPLVNGTGAIPNTLTMLEGDNAGNAAATLATDDGTTLTYTGTGGISALKLISTIAIGTAPFTVTSTTNVANLNASSLNGATFAAPGAIGGTTPAAGKFTTLTETALLVSNAAPTISSGFGTGAAVTANNGTAAFRIGVGTSSANTGVIGLPTATTGWNCFASDITSETTAIANTKQTASTTASATIGNFTDIAGAGAWADNDVLAVSCFAY